MFVKKNEKNKRNWERCSIFAENNHQNMSNRTPKNASHYFLQRIFVLFSFACFWIFSATASTKDEANKADTTALALWKAGTEVSEEAVKLFGPERCFSVSPISDAVFARMKGRSYKQDCTVPRSQLRYLRVLHRTHNGGTRLGEMVVNLSIAREMTDIFRQLYEAHYPIERMVLVDDYNANDEQSMQANNSSGFNFRRVAGSRKLSAHSTGHAIDINPLYNPYVKRRANGTLFVQPPTALPYANRNTQFPYKISPNDLCVRLFKAAGFRWGGDWKSSKDYQHFEKIR